MATMADGSRRARGRGEGFALAHGMLDARRAMARVVGVIALCGLGVAASGCGGSSLPPRGVIEADVSSWEFRRYQKVLDIEVWVPDNPAVAHTASYVAHDAARGGELGPDDVVSAVVTRFERADGVGEAVVELVGRLARESGYRVRVVAAARGMAIEIHGRGEAWMMWASTAYVVKVGGRGRSAVPSEVVSAYARHYPSTLDDAEVDAYLR